MFEYMQYNISPWGWELSLYFFLIGMTAMSFVLVAAPAYVSGLGGTSSDNLRRPVALLTLVLLAVCGALLIMDLGQPSRFLYPLIYFHASSPLSWGALFFVVFGVSVMGYLYAASLGKTGLLKPFAILGSVFGVLLPLYTGWDLMAQQARELWHSPGIPLLFVALSVTSGAGLTALVAMVTGNLDERFVIVLRYVLIGGLLVTLMAFAAESLRMAYGSAEEQQALAIINGELSTRYWILGFAVGIVAPLAVVLFAGRTPMMIMLAGVLSTVGAWALRDVILVAGQLPMSFY
ncbi:NrfD/PsrC family molybdoenzyme membrane anchor subunit [Aestuariirhabdus litorea]|uniref:Polysulfide reductase n=1 Tax=Aestuariirhabdus litorea TaxID=2528527 RepID=A0A3P3VJF1_9GAMM|nr:NrfD/PsrC family molybdoenzyme membrane anchor subunit [Aestuariirhabdus litorea]RRJ82812.1 hypothetical protein D0544_13250 [Aestuariirhabdus litorea]RWW92971.1 hypothetical protein DZC74_13225 [Endozoicomonadaceae bacterium GTF-13]